MKKERVSLSLLGKGAYIVAREYAADYEFKDIFD